jgi:hypothetical protein
MPRATVPLAFAAALVSLGIVADAHPGSLDGNGCHHETGTSRYHCHRTVAADAGVQAPAGKSRGNICHRPTPPNYATIECFIAFEVMEASLKSGGRAFGS